MYSIWIVPQTWKILKNKHRLNIIPHIKLSSHDNIPIVPKTPAYFDFEGRNLLQNSQNIQLMCKVNQKPMLMNIYNRECNSVHEFYSDYYNKPNFFSSTHGSILIANTDSEDPANWFLI
jgi:hypothetical protein